MVRGLGAGTVADEPDGGLNAALEHGARQAAGPAVAALSSDLPALRPEELAAALAAAEAAPRCFVPDAHGTGTTLLTAVGTPLRPHFGPGPPGRTAPAAPSPSPATGRAWCATSTPTPICAPRWPWASGRAREALAVHLRAAR